MDLQDPRNGGELTHAAIGKSKDRNRMARLVAVDEAKMVSETSLISADVMCCDGAWEFSCLHVREGRGREGRRGCELDGQREGREVETS